MKHRLLEEKGCAGGPARPFLLAVTDGRQKGNGSIQGRPGSWGPSRLLSW